MLDQQRVELNIPEEKPSKPAGCGSVSNYEVFVNGQQVQLPQEMLAQVVNGQVSASALLAMISSSRAEGVVAKNRAITQADLGSLLHTDGTSEGLM